MELFGMNFSSSERPVAAIRRNGGDPMPLQVTRTSDEHFLSVLQSGFQPGDYEIWVHNGTGGHLGWSHPIAFRVADAIVPARTIHVSEMSGETDQLKLQNALKVAATSGPSELVLSAGEYLLTSDLYLPAAANHAPKCILRGQGADATLLKTGIIANTSGQDRKIHLLSPGAEIRDMSLQGIELFVRSNHCVISGIHSDCYNQPVSWRPDFYDGSFSIADRSFVDADLLIENSKFTFFDLAWTSTMREVLQSVAVVSWGDTTMAYG